MFCQIRFSRNFAELDITADQIRRRGLNSEYATLHDSFINADFHICGTVRSLLPVPMTEEDRARYLYLQNFSYMLVHSGYYARQSHYRSYQLLYTYSGQAELVYCGSNYYLCPGTLFFADCLNPNEVRVTGSDWECADLHFHGGAADALYQKYFREASPLRTIRNSSAFQTLLEKTLLCHETVCVYHDWDVSSALQQLLRFLLDMSESSDPVAPEWLQFLVSYIQKHYSEPLTVDSLSARAGFSKYHLSREFKKYTGYAPYAYVTAIRIDRAKTLLRQTDFTCQHIADLVGIPDEANFIRAFRAKTQMTPGQFRASRSVDTTKK